MTDVDRTERLPRAYPLPRPHADPRFTFGLMLDVAAVLAAHGYPKVTSGDDAVELQQVLFRFLYAPAADPRPAIRNAKGHHA